MTVTLKQKEHVLSEISFSAPRSVRLAETPTGFPFVIHLPRAFYEEMDPRFRTMLRQSGVRIETKTPCFIKTDVEYIRLGLVYGDVSAASKLWEAINTKYSVMCYKNWL